MPRRFPDAARLGAAVRARRIELGMSQQELADELGLSRARISSLENGAIGQAWVLFETAAALGLELVALRRDAPGAPAVVTEQQRLLEKSARRVRRDR